MRVLVVDDNEMVRRVLLRHLARRGHDVVSAASYGDGLAALGQGAPDMAFVDVDLGGDHDGITLAAVVQRADPRTKIVIMSGNPSNQHRAREQGFACFLAKPFSAEEVADLA